jgi:hypothetical protein
MLVLELRCLLELLFLELLLVFAFVQQVLQALVLIPFALILLTLVFQFETSLV